MKVAITGGTGFIGQYLIRDYGDQVDFIVPTQRRMFDRLSQKAEYIQVNYNKEGFKKAFAGCDAVVHLGGRVMHGMSYELDTDLYISNITISENVFCACKELKIENIINASSVAVYDQIDEEPMEENAPCQPNSIYGIIKIAVEKLAELYNRRYGLKIKTFRFAQGIGIQSQMDIKQFWTILLINSIEKRPIPIWGSGKTGRDIIYVKDMAAAIISGLQHPTCSGIFNIGTEYICSNKEIAEAFCNVFHNTEGIIYLKDKQETGIRTCMNCQKARDVLKFSPQFNILKLVQDIKNEYEEYIRCGNSIEFY